MYKVYSLRNFREIVQNADKENATLNYFWQYICSKVSGTIFDHKWMFGEREENKDRQTQRVRET